MERTVILSIGIIIVSSAVYMGKCRYVLVALLLMAILNSCNLEKRVVVTTRGYDSSRDYEIPDFKYRGYYVDDNSLPRDTVFNYRF